MVEGEWGRKWGIVGEKFRNLLTNRTHTAGCYNTTGFVELPGYFLLYLPLILYQDHRQNGNLWDGNERLLSPLVELLVGVIT